jgi:3-oxoacyl-[acyl-carrier protein] reductase
VALVTGAGRLVGIGAAVARGLAGDGFDVALTHWSPYDARMPWGTSPDDVVELAAALGAAGARTVSVEADLGRPEAAGEIFERVEAALGPVGALVMCHCESVDSGLLETSLESFDRHFDINARATWLLVAEFGRRFRGPAGTGRIVAMTSDHVVGNLPYGASKAALDRIVLAAAHELAHLGVTANVINPGATDTGWMSPEVEAAALGATPLGRLGQPGDAANLVSFLCSAEGGWVNGQLLRSNGGAAS